MHLRARRNRSVGGNFLADRAISRACGSSSVAHLARGCRSGAIGDCSGAGVRRDRAQPGAGGLRRQLHEPRCRRNAFECAPRISGSNRPPPYAIQGAWWLARRGRYEEAAATYRDADNFEGVFLGVATARRATAAYIAVAAGSDQGRSLAIAARDMARQQDAIRWMRIAELLIAFCGSASEFGLVISNVGAVAPWNVTLCS